MKIYLRDENYDWKLFEGTPDELKPEFEKRNINIGSDVKIVNLKSK